MSLWAYSAIGGSLAALVSGLLSLLVPDRTWGLVVWAVLAVAFTTAAGLLADRFVKSEAEQ